MAEDFQKGLGRALKDKGFHFEYDPDSKETLPKGKHNPRGIKVAICNQLGRVGIVAAGEDSGDAVKFVEKSGYILERHNDGFVAVIDPKPGLSESIASLDKLWQDRPAPRPPMGQWLIENMPRGINLKIPDRRSESGTAGKKRYTGWLKWRQLLGRRLLGRRGQ